MSDGPFDLASQPLEEAAALAASAFVEVYRGLERRRVATAHDMDEIRDSLQGRLGDDGIGIVEAMREFSRDVLPRSMGTPHPLYLGLVNSSPLPAAALADLLVSSLNNNGGASHQSPAMSACEADVIDAFVRLFGMPPNTEGMLLPGGTFANLQGIVLARDHVTGHTPRPIRLYVAESCHFSVARAARVAGFHGQDIVSVGVDDRGAMNTGGLRDVIAADRAAGHEPGLVVATLGTTAAGAIDPLGAIADLCAEERIWLHVDACYGGAVMLLPELAQRVAGVERADSVTVDPHKWFFIPMTAGLLLSKHPEVARASFEPAHASYIPRDDGDTWLRGIPTSRRSSGFTVWMALRAHGWSTIRNAVRSNIELTRQLEVELREHGFRVLPGGELSIALARFEPDGVPDTELDALQARIAAHVVASGEAWFATTHHGGQTWLRFNLVNLHTRSRHIERLVSILTDAARGIASSGRATDAGAR